MFQSHRLRVQSGSIIHIDHTRARAAPLLLATTGPERWKVPRGEGDRWWRRAEGGRKHQSVWASKTLFFGASREIDCMWVCGQPQMRMALLDMVEMDPPESFVPA